MADFDQAVVINNLFGEVEAFKAFYRSLLGSAREALIVVPLEITFKGSVEGVAEFTLLTVEDKDIGATVPFALSVPLPKHSLGFQFLSWVRNAIMAQAITNCLFLVVLSNLSN